MTNPSTDEPALVDHPMFPLGSVLLPHMPLPLHIFEPRYRALVEHCLAGDRRFGVTLIERGSEVGGGELRALTGTMATIVEAERFDDGRYGLIAYGAERIRVVRWLDDDPFPRAHVERWPEPALSDDGDDMFLSVELSLRQALSMKAQLGDPATATDVEFTDDREGKVFQACGVAPLGPADQYALLCADSADDRVRMLAAMLADQIELLEARLAN